MIKHTNIKQTNMCIKWYQKKRRRTEMTLNILTFALSDTRREEETDPRNISKKYF